MTTTTSPYTADILGKLEGRLAELHAEIGRLSNARVALTATAVPVVRRGRPSTRKASITLPPRQQQMLDTIREIPASTPRQLAQVLNIQPPAAYPLLRKLKDAGLIEQTENGGWRGV